ncbi:MAG: RNA methyltransferase [Burkholderiaceae bacterium]
MTRRVHISSPANAQLVRIRRLLADPLAYRRLGVAWLEGEHLLQAALARGATLDAVFVDAAREHEPAVAALTRSASQVAVVESRLWRALSTLPSAPAVGALMAPRQAQVSRAARTVVLDRLQDAGNVGSILRSAAAFGVTQVVALKGSAGLWSPKVLRAAMGAHFALDLCEEAGDDALSALGVPLVATSSHDGQWLPQADLPEPCAWAFGHEGQGLSDALLARSALRVRIPQPGGEESLNVAAAAAVCLYESMRRRQ